MNSQIEQSQCQTVVPLDVDGNSGARPGVFLNTQFPVSCNGSAIGWHYCPYSIHRGERYSATFLLFHVEHFGSATYYSAVPGSIIVISESNSNTESGCTTVNLNSEQEFIFEAGDLIGVCYDDVTEDDYLEVVSNNTPNHNMVYQETGCSSMELAIVALSQEQIFNHAVHVSLLVRKFKIIHM